MKKQVAQLRQFRMHPDLLYSVIKAQAGTHEKALLEAVMNAVDAGATQCDITLDNKGYTIIDNGKGFVSKQEIEDFFETFGTPHKEGDATYGKFRMGRGQLFAFSRTVWNSNEFMMDVCIKTRGLDYLLNEGQKMFNGCKIVGTWHEKLKSHEIINMVRELKLLVKYMQIPIILNGETISCTASDQKWDSQIDEAYIKVSKTAGTLSVYNLGALVCHYPASKFGIGGIVVAKKQLTVNFARNDVLVSECKVWKKISNKLNDLMGIEVEKKTLLSDSERIAIVDSLISGKNYISKYMTKGLLTDVTSKKPTFNSLLKVERLSFSSGNYRDRIAEEQIHTQGLAFVLDHSMLERFMVTNAQEFVAKINELITYNNEYYRELAFSGSKVNGRQHYNHAAVKEAGVSTIYGKFEPTVIDMEVLMANFNSKVELKEPSKYNKKEKCMLKCLEAISSDVARLINYYMYRNKYQQEGVKWADMPQITPRKITIGVSKVADGWTDGVSYIAFNENVLKSNDTHNLVYLMLHEYCHNEATNETHSHPIEFMEMFHDIIRYQSSSVGAIINSLGGKLVKELTKVGIACTGLEKTVEEAIKLNPQLEEA